MAFVKCKYCKRMVSSNAHQCPFCKSSFKETIDKNSGQKIQMVGEKVTFDTPSQTSLDNPSARDKTNASKTDNIISRIYLGIVGKIQNKDVLKYIADKKKIIFLLLIIIIIFVSGYFLYFKSPERQARNVVDKHLQYIMTGKGNLYETLDIMKVKETFINVLDFKYLATTFKERVKDKPKYFTKYEYEKYYGYLYNSYDEFLHKYKKKYGNSAREMEGGGLVVESDDYHYEFVFLYDVTLTNKLGEKRYKKYIFLVGPSLISEYAITGVYEK